MKKEATNKRTDEQTNVLCPDAIYIYIFIHTYLYISCLVVSHTHTTDVLLQKYKKQTKILYKVLTFYLFFC